MIGGAIVWLGTVRGLVITEAALIAGVVWVAGGVNELVLLAVYAGVGLFA